MLGSIRAGHFESHFLGAQEQVVPKRQNLSKQGRSLAGQGASRAEVGKGRVWPLEVRSSNTAGLQACCSPVQGGNLCSQNSV